MRTGRERQRARREKILCGGRRDIAWFWHGSACVVKSEVKQKWERDKLLAVNEYKTQCWGQV